MLLASRNQIPHFALVPSLIIRDAFLAPVAIPPTDIIAFPAFFWRRVAANFAALPLIYATPPCHVPSSLSQKSLVFQPALPSSSKFWTGF